MTEVETAPRRRAARRRRSDGAALRARPSRRPGSAPMGVARVSARTAVRRRSPLGVVGGLIVGMTSVGSGSLMIVLLLFLYPGVSAPGRHRPHAGGAAHARGGARPTDRLRSRVVFGVTASLVIGRRAGRGRRLAALLERPRPLRAAGDRVRDPRLRAQVRGARDDGTRLDPVRRAARPAPPSSRTRCAAAGSAALLPFRPARLSSRTTRRNSRYERTTNQRIVRAISPRWPHCRWCRRLRPGPPQCRRHSARPPAEPPRR